MFHSNACRARRVFEKIITLVDRCHVEGGTGSDYGGMKNPENTPQDDGNPFSLATGCWRPVDKVLILITTLHEFNWLVWGANVSKGLIGKRLREYHVVKEAFTKSPQNSGLNTAFKICLVMAKDHMHTIYCHFMPLLGSQLRATPGYVSIRLPSVRALRLHQHILQGKPVLNLA